MLAYQSYSSGALILFGNGLFIIYLIPANKEVRYARFNF